MSVAPAAVSRVNHKLDTAVRKPSGTYEDSDFQGFELHDECEPGEGTGVDPHKVLATKGGKFSNVAAKIGGQVNVNGSDFWLQWAAAGGDADRYVTIPRQLTGTLQQLQYPPRF